jgi:hypothetical protein
MTVLSKTTLIDQNLKTVEAIITERMRSQIFFCEAQDPSRVEDWETGQSSCVGLMEYCIEDDFSRIPVTRYVKLINLKNSTLDSTDPLHGVGNALIERVVALCLNWRNSLKTVKLLSTEEAFYFYWGWGFRPENNLSINQSHCNEIFNRAKAQGKKPEAPNFGPQFLFLPQAAFQTLKRRLFHTPKLAHSPEFLNQLLLEKLEDAPDRIRRLVLEYSS